MKVGICTGSKCSFYGASFLMERLEEFQEDLKEMDGIKEDFELEIELLPCSGTCKEIDDIAPVVYVDGEVIHKASGPIVLEKIMNAARME